MQRVVGLLADKRGGIICSFRSLGNGVYSEDEAGTLALAARP
jgi:hypothetical protein